MHHSTYEYLKPTDAQVEQMDLVRRAAKEFAIVLDRNLPEGPDKDHVIRSHRQTAMWANVAITRLADGSPREDVKPRPTIEELEQILNSEDTRPMHIHPDGSISAL